MSAAIEPIPRTGPRADETRSLPEIGGIEITGVDVSEPLSRERKDWLMRTFRAHRALPHGDMEIERRVLHRTVVKGTVPY